MRLVWVRLDGFRRFGSRQTVKLDSKLVALVGPNEAGKTSILEALPQLLTPDPIPPRDLTRDYSPEGPVLTAAYYLERSDNKVLSDLPGGEELPRAHLRLIVAPGEHNCLANMCMLAASENRKISDTEPCAYSPNNCVRLAPQ